MSSRPHHRESNLSVRRQDRHTATWTPNDSDSDRPRQPVAAASRQNIDQGAEVSRRHHSSSRHESAANAPTSSASRRTHDKPSVRERSHSNPVVPSLNQGPQSQNQAVPPSVTHLQQRQEPSSDPYSLRALLMMKRKTSKRSPPSSSEKLEEAKHARPPLQSRSTFATTTSVNTLAPSSTQTYYIPPPTPRDPSSSTRQHRERDKDREKEREREKRRAESEKVRLAEAEAERLRAKEHERARRKEKDRASADKSKHADRDRSKDRDNRRLEDARTAAHGGASGLVSTQRLQVPDERMVPLTAMRHPIQAAHPLVNHPPSSSSSINLVGQQSRQHVSLTQAELDRATKHAKARERSRPSGQDSGMSSSEQESGKDRIGRISRHTEKRHRAHDPAAEGLPPGASGSETERPPHKRKIGRAMAEFMQGRQAQAPEIISRPPSAQAGATQSSRHPGLAAVLNQQPQKDPSGNWTNPQPRLSPSQKPLGVTQTSGTATYGVQPSLTVGPATSQRAAPQIVSIRAGQGPADPQTPLLPPKSVAQQAQYAAYQASNVQVNTTSVSGYPSKTSRVSNIEGLPSTSQSHGQQAMSADYATTSRVVDSKDAGPSVTYSHPGLQTVLSNDGIVRPQPILGPLYPGTSHRMVMSPSGAPRGATLAPTVLVQARVPTSAQAPDGLSQPSAGIRNTSNDRIQHRSTVQGVASSGFPQASQNDSRSTQLAVPSGQHSTTTSSSPSSFAISIDASNSDPSAPGKTPNDMYTSKATMRMPVPETAARFPVREDVYNATVDPTQGVSHMQEGIPLANDVGYTSRGLENSAYPSQSGDQSQNMGQGKYSPLRQGTSYATQMPNSLGTTATNTASHSPSRNIPANLTPNSAKGIALATPKHSPSGRLHTHRNGSDDTILLHGQRPSPSMNNSQQNLPHRSSSLNLASHAPSRLDTNAIARPPSTQPGYPEPTRYRAPTPASTYPSQTVAPSPYVSSSTNAAPSQSYSTQTAIFPSRLGLQPQASENVSRQGDPSLAAIAPQSTNQRVPPRSAPSPAPTTSSRQYHGVTSPPTRTSSALPMSPPPSTRTNTYPTLPSSRQAPSGHSRTASDPQHSVYGARIATASQQPSGTSSRTQASRTAPEAPVMAQAPSTSRGQQQHPHAAVPMMGPVPSQSSAASKDSRKKGGFFGLFRSRSTPPKQPEVRVPSAPTQGEYDAQYRRRRNASLQREDSAPQGIEAQNGAQARGGGQQSAPGASDPTAGAGVAAPTQPLAANGVNAKPFRLLSKRHRTVSSASVDAVDGTVLSRANTVLTGLDSARSSTAGRLSPPLRDPMTAAQEWRNKEEAELRDRGTRRRRPGVTFDMDADVADTITPRPPRRRRQPVFEE